jgi:hypothetical protein
MPGDLRIGKETYGTAHALAIFRGFRPLLPGHRSNHVRSVLAVDEIMPRLPQSSWHACSSTHMGHDHPRESFPSSNPAFTHGRDAFQARNAPPRGSPTVHRSRMYQDTRRRTATSMCTVQTRALLLAEVPESGMGACNCPSRCLQEHRSLVRRL